jgi:polyhydroxyalkanoate synthase
VLLLPSLAAPSTCFDLRRGCSLVEHLVDGGRPTYAVEYEDVSFADRSPELDHWLEHCVDELVPAAVEAVSSHAGDRPVHLLGWGLGAVVALLVAADRPELPIASVTSIGAPVDVTPVPAVAPFRPFLGIAGERAGLVTHAYRLLGGAPVPLVRRASQLSSFNRLVTKPIAIAAKLDDADFLAQLEAVDRFTARTARYPGRTYGQLYHRLLDGHALAGGTLTLSGREVSLADLRVPLLAVAGADDGIVPVESVRPVVDLATGAEDLRFEIVPGGHLGMLTGRAARRTTWPIIDDWLVDHSSAPAPSRAARRQAARSTAGPAAGPAIPPAARQTASRQGIGSNPRRRYGSASSRTLAPQ